MALKNPKDDKGNGYAAATLQDLGFEPTKGTTPRRRKNKGEGIAGAGLAGAGPAGPGACDRVVGEGVADAGKKSREEGGGHLTLKF